VYTTDFFLPFVCLWRYRNLVWQMSKREVISRYRGSTLGLLWSFFHPFFMLAIYTFIFSVVFQARWGQNIDNKTEFALVLFAGLIVYSLFAECINRAPALIIGHANYVKKVVFPLEILPWVAMGSALFHAVVSLSVLLVVSIALYHSLAWTVVMLPLLFFPLILMTVGLSWFLASCGVFLRDVGQTVSLCTTALLFMSPVFYPMSAVPEQFRFYLWLNPLTFIIEQARGVLLWSKSPSWGSLGLYMICSLVVAWLGLWWFQRTRAGFADVL
jgi:lipopolysaccharide transport system permease protein